MKTFDIEKIRQDFPILKQQVHNKPLVYLDNAATTQKPQVVIDAITNYYTSFNANVHRGIHNLSEQATHGFEAARSACQKFINAKFNHECIFTKGATEAINLVAATFGTTNIKKNDTVVISIMEHHANFVPWQMLCQQVGATLNIVPIYENGELDLASLQKFLAQKPKLLAINYISNALGTINPIEKIINLAHDAGTPVLVDAAQAGAHVTIDVQKLDCDFLVLAPHKMFAPTGIGILYAKEQFLTKMPPYQTGGEMILQVHSDAPPVFNNLPYKFEAGTPPIAAAIGLKACFDYLQKLDFASIQAYEAKLLKYATQRLLEIPGLRIIGTAKTKISLISFVLENIHPHDIGTILDNHGIAIRAGHHCTMPLLEFLQVGATARASFSFYNTYAEVDALCAALFATIKLFKKSR